jgi:hypothetical protein
VRAALVNAMTSLKLARPHALEGYQDALDRAIIDVKQATLEAMQRLHAGHKARLPHVQMGPPYANDPVRLGDRFNVHV